MQRRRARPVRLCGILGFTGGGRVSGRGDDTMSMLRGYAHMVDYFTRFVIAGANGTSPGSPTNRGTLRVDANSLHFGTLDWALRLARKLP